MRIGRGTFKRKSPAQFAEKIGIPVGWIALRHDHVVSTLRRRRTHGMWVRIQSSAGTIYRVVRYSVRLKADEIVVDWAGWIDLQGRTDQETEALELTISTVPKWQFFTIPFRHVDPAYRLSAWLAAISIGLGFLSILLSLR